MKYEILKRQQEMGELCRLVSEPKARNKIYSQYDKYVKERINGTTEEVKKCVVKVGKQS